MGRHPREDAIKKGFAEHHARATARQRPERETEWRVPYLPIDPADLGRSYDAVIRVNSQSGKGGIAYLLETEYGIELPRRLQIDLARHVQHRTAATSTEQSAAQLWEIFREECLADGPDNDIALLTYETSQADGRASTTVTVSINGEVHTSTHIEVGPVEALISALAIHGRPVDVLGLHQTSVRAGADSDALTLLEHRTPDGTNWAAGADRSVLTATLNAVIRSANTAPPALAGRR